MPEPQTSDLPALPRITGDLMLEAFSHKSLNLNYDPEMSTDNERLIELGRTALELAVTRYLYDKIPIVSGKDIPTQRSGLLTTEHYETWIKHYNLRQRLRYIQSDTLDITSPDETRSLFQAYVGAIVVQSGPNVAANWVTQLIDPKAKIHTYPGEYYDDSEDNRTSKRPRATEPTPPATPPPPVPEGPPPVAIGTASHVLNPAHYGAAAQKTYNTGTAAATSPVTGGQAVPNTSAPKPPGFLPLLNEKCSQAHVKVEYKAVNHALPHAPLWVTTCLVNGIQKGEGQGSSKQVAKEAAAKQAYYAMGWAAYGLPG